MRTQGAGTIGLIGRIGGKRLVIGLIGAGLIGIGLAGLRPGIGWSQPTSAVEPAERPHPRTRIVMLGTGTPNADPDRSGPCVALVVDDTPYLVDAGPGLVRRAAAAARAGVAGLAVEKLARVFITHLHSDHTLGLPDLIFTPWVLERSTPLAVYGPPGTAAMVGHIEAAWAEDIDIRLHGGEPSNPTGWRAEPHEIEPGVIYRDSLVTVTAFPVRHGSWAHAYGYRFDTPDCAVVISGDTAPCDSVVAACNGCDVLIHEAYSSAGFAGRPSEWQRYHARYHTSAADVGRLATRARAGRVILYHQLRWGRSDAEMVEEVRRSFGGRVDSGEDLEEY